jgi:hypothetical protein
MEEDNPPTTFMWVSNVAFYRERGETYKAIGERFGLSKERIRQLVAKHERMMLANSLQAVRTYIGCDWDTRMKVPRSYNMEETKAIVAFLRQLAKGAPHGTRLPT